LSGPPNGTTRLGSIEIILIFFIIFLWLFSVLCCLKRYSLLLCFRKRDAAPFFDEYLTKIDPYPKPINKINNTNSFSNINGQKNDNLSIKYSSSMLNQSNYKLSKPNSLQHLTSLLVRQQLELKNKSKIKPKNFQSYTNSKLSLDYARNPSSSTTIKTNDTGEKIKKRRQLLGNNVNKHFNLLSLDETLLKHCNYKLAKYKHHPDSPSMFLKAQNSIQESDNSSIIYNHDYCCEDNSSLFEISTKPVKYLKAQLSLSPNTQSSFNSLYRTNHRHISSMVHTKPIHSVSIDICSLPTTTTTAALTQNQLKTECYLTKNRQINPVSSARRQMFVNSRKKCSAHVNSNGELASSTQDVMSSASVCPNNTISSTTTTSTGIELEPLRNVCTVSTQKHNSTVNTIPIKKFSQQDQLKVVDKSIIDPNLLNPAWIPSIVRKTLLDLHHRAVSKSDSNIKFKRCQALNGKEIKRKKPLSLQNSEDKSCLLNINSPVNLELLEEARKVFIRKSNLTISSNRTKARFY
jgi:hypothetical protein